MAIRLGKDCKAYYGAAGSTATNLIDNIRDVTLGLSKNEADVTTRGNNGWRATVGVLKGGNVSFQMLDDTGDAAFLAVQAAWENDTAIAMLFLDAVSGTGHGLDADFSVIEFTRNEALEEAVSYDITVKPTYSTRAPKWVDPT